MWWLLWAALASAQPRTYTFEVVADAEALVPVDGSRPGFSAGARVGYPIAIEQTGMMWEVVPELRVSYLSAFPVPDFNNSLGLGVGGRLRGLAWHGDELRKRRHRKLPGRQRFASTLDVGPYVYVGTTQIQGIRGVPREMTLAFGGFGDFRYQAFVGGAHLGWTHGMVTTTGHNGGALTVGIHGGARF